MKKNYIYVGIIVVCVGIMVWALVYMNSGSPASESPVPAANTNTDATSGATTAAVGKGTAKTDYTLKEYSASRVFPENKKYNFEVVDDPQLKRLNDYSPLAGVPAEEVGRDNLYTPY